MGAGYRHIIDWHRATTSECPTMKEGDGNRGEGREKRRPAMDLRWPSQATARRVRGHESFQPGADRRPCADPCAYRAGSQRPAQQPRGLSCHLARRIRRANGLLTLSLHSGPNNHRKDFRAFLRCASARCFASSRGRW
jgi:hypothetical protein